MKVGKMYEIVAGTEAVKLAEGRYLVKQENNEVMWECDGDMLEKVRNSEPYNNILHLRLAYRMGARQLGARIGASWRTVQGYENGKAILPARLELLKKVLPGVRVG